MLSSELRDAILSFIDCRSSVTDLEEWLVPRLTYYLQSPDIEDADLVSAVELALAEMSAGIRTVADIRSDLNAVIQPLAALSHVAPRPSSHRIVTGTSNSTVMQMVGSFEQTVNRHMEPNWAPAHS